METEEKYQNYTVEDFICDEDFQDWVMHPTEHRELFWKKWLQENPGKEATVTLAAQILSSISFQEHFPTKEKIAAALEQHLQQIAQMEESRLHRRAGIRRWLSAAAILSGIILLGYGSYRYWHTHAKITISTDFGQLKSFYLPDSSLITLNAHSTLKYPRFWSENNVREVWLKGQGYFRIKPGMHTTSSLKQCGHFIVHTGNGLNVQVLGTVFDVKSYHDNTAVMLRQGAIKVNFPGDKQQDIVMQPGDLVRYNLKKNQLEQTTADPLSYTAWTDRKIILKGTSVREVAQRLQEFYGYAVTIKDSAIGDKNMEGLLMLDSLPDVIFALSTSLNIKIEQKGDTLIFEQDTPASSP